jgi:hypothetical protein
LTTVRRAASIPRCLSKAAIASSLSTSVSASMMSRIAA